ncbi:HPr-rel-A system PqqD family peptide chaperone [Paucibacter soli]|uniref:HPr-rel-A system PqqD family peptide chaperone n=1 Tax=Paucibacter soli TaxID=3133433 RepID=UPI0030A3AA87
MWQSTGRGAIKFRRWPAQWAVFNPVTGNTHLLEEAAGMVLEALDQSGQPLSAEALYEQLYEQDASADPLEFQALLGTLESFARLALIESPAA